LDEILEEESEASPSRAVPAISDVPIGDDASPAIKSDFRNELDLDDRITIKVPHCLFRLEASKVNAQLVIQEWCTRCLNNIRYH
jgi:hypothetical protein